MRSLEDEVEDYRNNLSTDLAANAFVMATKTNLSVVFTSQEPTTGVAVVEGSAMERTISDGNRTLGVIAATDVTVNQTGVETSVKDVAENSAQYSLDLVRVDAHYRRISTLTDPDQGTDFTLSTTTGILADESENESTFFRNVADEARAVSRNTSTDQLNRTLSDPRETHLYTFSFETKFWASANATVDAIVLHPESAARRFITEYDRSNAAYSESAEPILYVVNETFRPRSVENVSVITSQSEFLDGEMVETELRLYQKRISVQETLEDYTGCGEDEMQVPTQSGSVCVNIVYDELLHGGAAWNAIPQHKEDILFILGVSPREQDAPTEFKQGRYTVEGEVVSTARINESLPEGSALVVSELKREGAIEYDAVANESRTVLENQTAEFTQHLKQQINRTDYDKTLSVEGFGVFVLLRSGFRSLPVNFDLPPVYHRWFSKCIRERGSHVEDVNAVVIIWDAVEVL